MIESEKVSGIYVIPSYANSLRMYIILEILKIDSIIRI